MSATKIGGNTTAILNCYFKINLHFGTSDYISTYGKLNLLPINSIFWSSLLEKCKDWCRQKYTTSFPYPVLKEVSHKPLKIAAAKKSFPSVFIINTTCFDEGFSFHVINANSIFTQSYRYPEAWFNRHVAVFFQTNFWEEVRILYPLSPQQYYDDANIAKVQNKASTS